MRKLYINGDYKGEFRGWHKNKMLNRYSFLMTEGYYISVDIDNIVSQDDLVNLYTGDISIDIYG